MSITAARSTTAEPAVQVLTRALGSPGSLALARELTRQRMCAWGLADRADDAVITVSELATNAFRHGAPPVTLTLAREWEHGMPAVTCVVCDGGRWRGPLTPAVAADVCALAEGGRGLAIARELADSVLVAAQADGTMVLARFLPR